MEHQFRMAPEIKEWASRLTAPCTAPGVADQPARRTGCSARSDSGLRPCLDAACQRHLVTLQRSRREVADLATARKRLGLLIADLERQADDPGRQAADAGQAGTSGRDNTTDQLAELRRRHADLQVREEQATAVSRRLMAEINAFRAGQEATGAAYTAAEEAARTIWPR